MKYYVMTLRGDWKFLKQCLNLKRHPQTEKICFSCLATKGNHEPEMNFTDLRPAATWKNTVFSSPTPWGHSPSVRSLRFFDIQKIGLDLLHIWHLGVARDLCHVLNGAPSFPFLRNLKLIGFGSFSQSSGLAQQCIAWCVVAILVMVAAVSGCTGQPCACGIGASSTRRQQPFEDSLLTT